MFNEYQSKPIIRRAYQIKSAAEIVPTAVETRSILRVEGHKDLWFCHYEPVAVNDWIVYLNESDVYHCTDKVFRERNIVN
ncbi:MAG: hypothetical protein ACRCZA_05700 [Shewanella sp.]|uniref:hypothetical protein n=1 Tax=Shewanella sp. TaxID=50422 RepID=UPI003F361D9C